MNILSWEPVVPCRFAGGSFIEPSIHLKVTLKCPHCEQTEKVEPSGHLIWGVTNTPFSELVDWQVSEFTNSARPHDCAHCGRMYVPVPRAAQKTFSKSVHDLLTDKWLAQKLEELKREAKRKWKNSVAKYATAK